MLDADPQLQVAAVASAATSHTTTCDGCRIAWKQWGAGPPLVLLHGDAGSWTHWIRNVLALGRRFRVLVPDLPGYGASATPGQPATPASLAALLAEGLAALPDAPRRYRLAGFSFGGIVAGHLAALDVDRVERLILLGAGGLGLPIPPLSAPLRRPGRDMMAAELADVHRHNLAVLMFGDPARVDRLATWLQIENVR
ncbi:MAG TPA: alpha/beta fold hydrolase, partial [Acetobacteraceae bacterium]|nr:alpha/beta fold hydrolase [Acetobacteraceae bacterium]